MLPLTPYLGAVPYPTDSNSFPTFSIWYTVVEPSDLDIGIKSGDKADQGSRFILLCGVSHCRYVHYHEVTSFVGYDYFLKGMSCWRSENSILVETFPLCDCPHTMISHLSLAVSTVVLRNKQKSTWWTHSHCQFTLTWNWPSVKLPFESQKNCQKLAFFHKKLPKMVFLKRIANFLTFKLQFSGG